MDFDIGFGCGLFVYTGSYDTDITEANSNANDWKNWRSFFFHGTGYTRLKFVEKKYLKKILAVVEEGRLDI